MKFLLLFDKFFEKNHQNSKNFEKIREIVVGISSKLMEWSLP
jgi:hypothetical protein